MRRIAVALSIAAAATVPPVTVAILKPDVDSPDRYGQTCELKFLTDDEIIDLASDEGNHPVKTSRKVERIFSEKGEFCDRDYLTRRLRLVNGKVLGPIRSEENANELRREPTTESEIVGTLHCVDHDDSGIGEIDYPPEDEKKLEELGVLIPEALWEEHECSVFPGDAVISEVGNSQAVIIEGR